jgi:hypothetical protein|tara:strand:+ start:92 stop:457 length:366 start_codon:yes stop_codon:yes gene_type:complete
LVVAVVVLVTQVVVVTVVRHPSATTVHLVVDRVQTVVSSMKVLLVATLTKVLLESMVDRVKGTETRLVSVMGAHPSGVVLHRPHTDSNNGRSVTERTLPTVLAVPLVVTPSVVVTVARVLL